MEASPSEPGNPGVAGRLCRVKAVARRQQAAGGSHDAHVHRWDDQLCREDSGTQESPANIIDVVVGKQQLYTYLQKRPRYRV